MGSEPLPFSIMDDDNDMGQEIARHHLVQDYGYHGGWLLPECTHPVVWVATPFLQTTGFAGKGLAHLESRSRVCQYLQKIYVIEL